MEDRGQGEQNNSECAILHQSEKYPKEKMGLERGENRARGGLRARRKQASRKRQEEASGGQGQRIDFTGERAASGSCSADE